MQHFYKSVIVLVLITFELQLLPVCLVNAEYVSSVQILQQNRGNKNTLQQEYCTLGTDATHIDPPILLQSSPTKVSFC